MRITSRDMAFFENYIYFFSAVERVLFRMNINDYKVEIVKIAGIDGFPDIDRCVIWDKKLYANDISGNYLVEIGIGNNNFIKYDLDFNIAPDGNVSLIKAIGEQLYIVGKRNKKIAKLQKGSKKIETILMPEYLQNSEYVIACEENENIWIFPSEGDVCSVYNTKIAKWEVFTIKFKLNKVRNCIYNTGSLYLLEEDGTVCKMDIALKKCERVVKAQTDAIYTNLICTDNEILIFCANNGEIEKYDKNTFKLIDKIKSNQEHSVPRARNLYSRYYGYCKNKEWVYFANRVYEKYLRVNINNGNIEWYTPVFPDEKELIRYRLKYTNGAKQESSTITLIDYVGAITE